MTALVPTETRARSVCSIRSDPKRLVVDRLDPAHEHRLLVFGKRACAPPSPSRRARSPSASSLPIAPANASASPGATVRPSSPSRATRGTPLGSAVLTTGRPAAMASICAMPKVSASPSRKHERACRMQMDLQVVARQCAGQNQTIGDAELAGLRQQIVAQRPLADDDGGGVDVAQRFDQHGIALVRHQPAGRHDQTGMLLTQRRGLGLLVRIERAPIGGVDPERHYRAFRRVRTQQRRPLDDRAIRDDDLLRARQAAADQRRDQRPQRAAADDLAMPMDHQRDPRGQAQDSEIVERKRMMQRDQIARARLRASRNGNDGASGADKSFPSEPTASTGTPSTTLRRPRPSARATRMRLSLRGRMPR